MARRRSARQIVTTYVLSLVATLSLLVVWVIYVVRSVNQVRDFAGRAGFSGGQVHWIVLAVGCGLFFLLIAGLSHQLAQVLTAQRYSRKQEEFLSHVTHELKSPIAAIKLHAQTLQQGGLRETDAIRSAGFIQEQADRMSLLVDAVLESSRLLAGKRREDLVPIPLATFFARYFEGVRPRFDAEHLRLVTEVATEAAVLGDESGLERIMNNLLDNAARFSDPGGEVRCRVDDDGTHARIEVEDEGIGIPRKELERIFERFYQVGGDREARRKGTGLGLSIVAELVAEMGGRIEAISQEGRRGARFVVDLPLAAEGA